MKSIIYLPELGKEKKDSSLESYVKRYMISLEKINDNTHKRYSVEYDDISYGDAHNFSAKRAVISESIEDGAESKIVEIIGYNYNEELTSHFRNKKIFIQAFYLFSTLSIRFWKLMSVVSYRKTNLSFDKKVQVFFMLMIFMMLTLFGIFMIPSIVTVLFELLDKLTGTKIESLLAFKWNIPFTEYVFTLETVQKISATIVSMTTVALVFFPEMHENMTKMSSKYLCVDHYLSYGKNKLEIIGKLETLISKVDENKESTTLELHSYSFGSIILLDLIFPYKRVPLQTIQRNVSKIVTIGCPYDFIKQYYPNYFANRNESDAMKKVVWQNVFCQADVFSSNFRRDNKCMQPMEDVEDKSFDFSVVPHNLYFDVYDFKTLGSVDKLFFIGFRAHGTFWGTSYESVSCLQDLLSVDKKLVLK
ncbi:hypothetical protein [Aureivirga sp. CE67]|uniref:hypothetical protein n=1 Tax=Aureivirga sp. CE67 TaxID=1788983 RepID=UPI0018CA4D6F|nr:hypothetical protein [Aureivirga sp. CE67]